MKRILVTFILFLSSCRLLYGIKNVESNDYEGINQFIVDNQLNEYSNFILDAKYGAFIKAKFNEHPKSVKYLLQPIQALYFSENDSLISYHVNCNAGGFMQLNWNKGQAFSSYPPISQTQINTTLQPRDIIPYLMPSNNQIKPFSFERKAKVIVLYSLMLPKQSKALINLVRSNIRLAKAQPQLVLINTDNLED